MRTFQQGRKSKNRNINKNTNNNNNYNNGNGDNRRNTDTRLNQNRNNQYFKSSTKQFVPHVIFDFIQAEHSFQRVKPVSLEEEKLFNDALIKKNQDLTPNAQDMGLLSNLLTQIQTVFDNLILVPDDFDACLIDEIKQVGSYKKGTMISKSKKFTADLCLVLKTLPTIEIVEKLSKKVLSELNTSDLSNNFIQIINENGFEIVSNHSNSNIYSIQVNVTTLHQNIRNLDPNVHSKF
jgi:interleukin enhancer-binding factor 2